MRVLLVLSLAKYVMYNNNFGLVSSAFIVSCPMPFDMELFS